MTDSIRTVASTRAAPADRRGSGRSKLDVAAEATALMSTIAAEQTLRLMIEEIPGVEDGYVYKFFDRTTGELKMELPREEAEKMSQSDDYRAGKVFSARV